MPLAATASLNKAPPKGMLRLKIVSSLTEEPIKFSTSFQSNQRIDNCPHRSTIRQKIVVGGLNRHQTWVTTFSISSSSFEGSAIYGNSALNIGKAWAE